MQYLHPRSAAMDVWANRLRGSILSVTVGIAGLLGALVPGAGGAQQVTGTLGAPSATTTIRGNQLPPAPPAFGGVITQDARTSKPWWPPTVVPPKGAPNVLLIMTDDSGFGVPSTFRRRDPDAQPRPHRQERPALHAVPFDRAVLADARRADHRPQPPCCGLRPGQRVRHRLPRLRLGHRDRERDHRAHPLRQWLRDLLVRQEPQHAGVPLQRRRAVRPVANWHGLPVLLRLHGRRVRPVDALPVPQHDARSSLGSVRRTTT
jgi:hypothetical protein